MRGKVVAADLNSFGKLWELAAGNAPLGHPFGPAGRSTWKLLGWRIGKGEVGGPAGGEFGGSAVNVDDEFDDSVTIDAMAPKLSGILGCHPENRNRHGVNFTDVDGRSRVRRIVNEGDGRASTQG